MSGFVVLAFLTFTRAPFARVGHADASAAARVEEGFPSPGEMVGVSVASRGAPSINIGHVRDVPTAYQGEAALTKALEQNQARPRALASGDFDEDGVPDLVGGYAFGGRGVITLARGNVDSIYPNAPEAQERKARGAFTSAPFLSPARAFAASAAADFVGAGDFDGDGHWDVVTAARGGMTLYLFAGDGKGGVSASREIELPGAVTALVDGEVNRRDGLTDIAVGVAGASGAKVLVFEGPDGALMAQPEVFALSAPTTSMALGQLDDGYEMELAVAAGNELLLVHGRDRKLSQDGDARATVKPALVEGRLFASAIKFLTVGDFIGGPQADIALLDEDGAVRVLSRESDGRQVREKDGVGREEAQALSDWDSEEEPTTTRQGRLVSAYMSGDSHDDLVILGSAVERLRLLNWPGRAVGPDAAGGSKPGAEAAYLQQASVAVEGEPVAVVPMRLDADALSDLVILREGRAAPAVALTHQNSTAANGGGRPSKPGIAASADVCPRTPINIGQTVNGELSTTDCRFTDGNFLDPYSFTGIAGQYVSITATSSSFDTYVDLLGPDNLLMAFDGFNERKRTSQLVFGLPEDGTYDIRVSSFDPGTTGAYTLQTALLSSISKTFTVTNTNDSGAGSLRQAVLDANANPGPDTIVFQVGTGPQTIAAAPTRFDVTDAVTIDGTTQPGFVGKPIIEVTGSSFYITGGRSVIRGLVMNRNGGIQIDINKGNIVEGNYLCTDITGTIHQTNQQDTLFVLLSSNNKVGGTTLPARNLIACPTYVGGFAQFVGADNVVQGNLFGTDVTGDSGLVLSTDFGGLSVRGPNNTVGGTTAGARNVISGNEQTGLEILAEGTLVQGNYIGTDITGAKAIPNGFRFQNSFPGIELRGNDNTIGGTTVAARNIISGNAGRAGILVGGDDTGSLIQGNFIGTDVTGTLPIANRGEGVSIFLGNGNTVGGVTPGARNVISGNTGGGVSIEGFAFITSDGQPGGGTATNNKIQGNFIGTDITGGKRLGNGRNGVQVTISGSEASNTIGGADPNAGNVISANSQSGVAIGIKFTATIDNQGNRRDFTGGTGVLVQNNYIGKDATGTGAMGNALDGVFVDADSFTNTIANNIVADNVRNGVFIPDASNPGVKILIDNNAVFSNGALGIDLGGAGVTPNDPGDVDTGANFLQNFPVLNSNNVSGADASRSAASSEAGGVTVSGSLNSTPNTSFTLHWYFTADQQCTNNQFTTRPLVAGKVPNVVTDASGNAPFSFPLSFPPGVPSGVVNCTATDSQGNTSEFSACLPVRDAPSPPPTLATGDVTVVEGGAGATSAVFPVTLSAASDKTITVNFATADGTATAAGDDYKSNTGTLSFNPGETQKSVTVQVNGDTSDEPDETFFVNLTAPANASLADAQGSCVIRNDDAPSLRFSAPGHGVGEGGGRVTVTVNRAGDPSTPAAVSFATTAGTASDRSDYTTALGKLHFAAGETSKSFSILVADDAYVEGDESFGVALSDAVGAALGSPATATVTITDNDSTPATVNPLDITSVFVLQHYADFLNREPDPSGFAFWVNEVEGCGQDAACRELKRLNVSAAFYLSIEFQQTGFLVYRTYKTAYGNIPGAPVPVALREFLADTQAMGQGVQVGIGEWQQRLESNKGAFCDEFVTRGRFTAAYPTVMTSAAFTDALNANSGGVLSQGERDRLVNELSSGAKTRAQVLRAIVENPALIRAELNRAFVLMQYFGYLRRDPNAPPDNDFSGYNFWLGKLDQFNGDFQQAEMVNAFITSIEYRKRFNQ